VAQASARPTIKRVRIRNQLVVLGVIAVLWLVFAAVNLARDRVALGVLYASFGVITIAIVVRVWRRWVGGPHG
jgi:hypothetical protein